MRPIRFRAWDKRLNEMFHFIKPDFCMEYGTLSFESVENPGICNFPTETDFANWELMQFTGLRDKNGKEIYEGDLVVFGKWEPGKWKIDWNEDCARWDLFWVGGGEEGWMNLCNEDDDKVTLDLKVIGNIHESPSLLGKEGKE